MNRRFKFLQVIPVRRATDGWIFGVFKGFADHVGFPCLWTRVLGVLVLLGLGGAFEKVGPSMPIGSIVLYVVLALAMQPPARGAAVNGYAEPGSSRLQPVFPTTAGTYATPVRPLDLAALEQRVESLGRRLAKMENVVVTRERDWDRRLGT